MAQHHGTSSGNGTTDDEAAGDEFTDDDGPELDAAARLRMIDEQQERTRSRIEPDGRVLYGAWGLGWLAGYLAMWLSARGNADGMPEAWGGWTLTGVLVVAMVVTIVHSVAAGQGVRGASSRAGAMFGWTWFIAFSAYGALLGAIAEAGASDRVIVTAANGFACVISGLMFVLGAQLFRDNRMFLVGAWMMVTAVFAAFAGPPTTYLVMAFAGGGGYLVMAVVEHLLQLRRRRRGNPAPSAPRGGLDG